MKMIVDARQQYFPEYAELAAQLDHDVRSPLTAICTYTDCLEQASAEPERREWYARAVKSEARRLGRLCADFAALIGPQPEERVREVDVLDALRAALEELKGLSQIAQVSLEILPMQAGIMVFWPAGVLRHLLTATLESVLMSVAQGDTVQIEARSETRDVALAVSCSTSKAFLCSPERLSFRAAARLVGTRGGSMMVLDGEAPQVRVNIPFSGHLIKAPTAPLEQSA
jgi:K+-sensing histidine kinase KdpD